MSSYETQAELALSEHDWALAGQLFRRGAASTLKPVDKLRMQAKKAVIPLHIALAQKDSGHTFRISDATFGESYQETVDTLCDAHEFFAREPRRGEALALVGFIAEISILSLINRARIRQINDSFAVPSTLQADQGKGEIIAHDLVTHHAQPLKWHNNDSTPLQVKSLLKTAELHGRPEGIVYVGYQRWKKDAPGIDSYDVIHENSLSNLLLLEAGEEDAEITEILDVASKKLVDWIDRWPQHRAALLRNAAQNNTITHSSYS